MIYLASPYTHRDEAIVCYRYTVAEKITAKLLCDGMVVYSPIVHCHHIAKNHTLPTDFAFWKKYNFAMLSKADELYVLKIDGWGELTSP